MPNLRLEIRDLVKTFAPGSISSRLLHWDSALDNEDGSGISVSLLDSGIYLRHPAFHGAQIEVRDFTRCGTISDATGHGTKNAGLLVSQGRGWPRGIVPGCTLLVGKVMGSGFLNESERALARAIRWSAYMGSNVIILPLGRVRGSPLVTREVHRALLNGCAFFASAGNRGPDELLYPASINGVTAVSAAAQDGTPLEGCCQTSRVDLFAPGLNVWSIGGRKNLTITGSSAATVLAAGVAALRLAKEQRLRHDSN